MMLACTRRSGARWFLAVAPALLLAVAPAQTPAVPLRDGAPAGAIEVLDHTAQVTVELGHSRRLRARGAIGRTAVVDSTVSDVIQVAPREVLVLGKGKGTTHVTIWLEEGDGPRKPIVILVRVVSDSQSPP